MGVPCDDAVVIQAPEAAGDPSVISVSCPDKTGLGCDFCRVILFFGLSILRVDVSTDGKWCYVVFWVEERGGRPTPWGLLKNRLLAACPVVSVASGLYNFYYGRQELMLAERPPQVFLLKFSCYDRMGVLHGSNSISYLLLEL
ncbi:hypothetical protein GW17_00005383 [Ensete ventricosum]|nr:hypothetical protein GW17_00005383 [Ensete ventricosum]